jgi:hypothetical protein
MAEDGSGSVGITSVGAVVGVETVPGWAVSARSGGGPTAASHVQFHVQSQFQLSGVWLSISVARDVVSPQNVKVQVQFHGPPAVSVPVGSPSVAAEELAVWLTGPLSPGLRTRTDTLVLPEPEEEEEGDGEPSSVSLDPEGLASVDAEELVFVSVHDQSHIHSHVQSIEDGFPVSVDDDVVFPAQSIVSHQLQYHGSSDGSDSD